jgi:hypothetical protein
MLYVEGPIIMKESLSDADAAYIKLANEARRVLAHPRWDRLVSDVHVAKTQFHNTILPSLATNSSHYCGIGPQADEIKHTLVGLLPGFQITAGDDQDHDCSHRAYFEKLQNHYDALIESLLANHPLKSEEKVNLRDELLNKTTSQVDFDNRSLAAMLTKLQGVTTFFPDLTMYHEAARLFETVSEHYRESYNRLLGFSGQDAGFARVSPTLAAPALDEIATPWRVPNVVVERANRATTWIFLIIAVGVDLIASLLAANLVYVLSVNRSFSDFTKAAKSVRGSDVSYLWRP